MQRVFILSTDVLKGPPGPPKYEKKKYIFHILGLKQERPSMIRASQIAQNIHILFKYFTGLLI